jgi:hypothetical protein
MCKQVAPEITARLGKIFPTLAPHLFYSRNVLRPGGTLCPLEASYCEGARTSIAACRPVLLKSKPRAIRQIVRIVTKLAAVTATIARIAEGTTFS